MEVDVIPEKKDSVTFAYKIYEATFLSLFLSTFVSFLETASNSNLNLIALVIGHSSLFLPLLFAIAIYHVVFTKRYEFNKSLEKWTNCASILLVFSVFCTFQEIIPVIRSITPGEDFISLYTQAATLNPISIIFLAVCYSWLYGRAFREKKPPQVMVLAYAPVLFEISIIGNRMAEQLGAATGTVAAGIVIALIVIRQYWWRD